MNGFKLLFPPQIQHHLPLRCERPLGLRGGVGCILFPQRQLCTGYQHGFSKLLLQLIGGLIQGSPAFSLSGSAEGWLGVEPGQIIQSQCGSGARAGMRSP
jgi:hypothetical protein